MPDPTPLSLSVLTELRARAENIDLAFPGGWTLWDKGEDAISARYEVIDADADNVVPVTPGFESDDDVRDLYAYLAAASPSVILALLADLTRSGEEREALSQDYGALLKRSDEFERERDALREDAARWQAIRPLLDVECDYADGESGAHVQWLRLDEEKAGAAAQPGWTHTVESLIDAARSPQQSEGERTATAGAGVDQEGVR